MFIQSLWLILAKFFGKADNEAEDQRIEKMIEELELDESWEIDLSTEKKGSTLLQSREVGNSRGDDNDLNSDSRKLCRLEIHNRRLISELADATLYAEM